MYVEIAIEMCMLKLYLKCACRQTVPETYVLKLSQNLQKKGTPEQMETMTTSPENGITDAVLLAEREWLSEQKQLTEKLSKQFNDMEVKGEHKTLNLIVKDALSHNNNENSVTDASDEEVQSSLSPISENRIKHNGNLFLKRCFRRRREPHLKCVC